MKNTINQSHQYLAYRIVCPPPSGMHANNPPPLEEIHLFRPSLCHLQIQGERLTIKGWWVRLCFLLMSGGHMRIAYVRANDGRLAHTSCIVPKCFKFPFLETNDVEIGPCLTYPCFRKQGIYVKVLQYIVKIVGDMAGRPARCYMFVNETNVASVKGIERAGFSLIGQVTISRWLKTYRLQRNNTDD